MFRLFAIVTVLFMTTDAQLHRTSSHKMDSIRESSKNVGTNLQEILSLSDNLPSVHLTNFKNMYYYGSIKIGTPQQKFKVMFDAGTADIWIFSKECTKPICCSSVDSKHNQYDSTRSKTYNNKKKSRYLNSHTSYIKYFYVEGNVAIDTVNIANLNIKNQTFLEAVIVIEYPNVDMCAKTPFDGIFGLRSFTIQDYRIIMPIFDNMIEQGLVSSRIFSFYLNRDTSADLGGKLIFGGSDPAFYEGDFTYVTIIKKRYWQLTLDSIQINNLTLCEESCLATVDTSAWQINGPQTDISNIYDFTETNSQGIVNCDRIFQLPTIRFILGGKAFDLTGEDYIIRHPDNESICITTFHKQDSVENKKWVLGIPFIGRFYTEFDFDKERVGFALAKHSTKHIENSTLSPFISRNYTEFDIEKKRVGFALAKNSSKHMENITLSPLIDRNYTDIDIEKDRVGFAMSKNSSKRIENISLSSFIVYFIMKFLNYWFSF